MPKLNEHPGYLGLTSAGIILIHADWPAYAVEHGWQHALISLAQFPSGTAFKSISEIDQCFLLFVGDPTKVEDRFDDRHFHIAIWNDDLLDLANRGYVSGAGSISYRNWARRQAELLRNAFFVTPDGVRRPVEPPRAEDFEDPDALRGMVEDCGVSVTSSGFQVLESILADGADLIAPEIDARTRNLLDMGLHDTAIREACLVLESEIRDSTGTRSYGMRLVDEWFTMASSSDQLIMARLKTFRTDVRTFFKFVRNDYMHNLRELSAAQCKSILVRISGTYVGIRTISQVLRASR